MEPNARGYANCLTIGCRFVPSDQWLVTHLDTSWKISDVKRWLLAKCLPGLFTPIQPFPRPRSSQRRRPVSPITFASRDQVEQDGANTDGSEDEDYDDDEGGSEISDTFFAEKYKYTPGPAGIASTTSMIPTSSSVVPTQYMLLAFSTGQILEDHNCLSWYSLYPHEFLELHNCNNVVKLPRELIEDYVEPYFEAKVWALKTIFRPEESEGTPKAVAKYGRISEAGDSERDRTKKRRTKLQWQEGWIVIHRGLLRLCIDRNGQYPPHTALLSSLISLRGAEHLQHIRGPSSTSTFPSPPSSQHASPRPGNSPVTANKRIVCMKFRTDNYTPESSGFWQGQWRRGSKDVETARKSSAAGLEAISAEDESGCLNDGKGENTVLVVVDMLEDNAYTNILRVLHRYAPGISSSFFPASTRMRSPRRRSYSPISFASGSSGQPSPAQSPTLAQEYPHSPDEAQDTRRSVRYPEWRIEIMRRARRAGLGDVGRAMEWAMFGSEELEEELEEGSDVPPEVDFASDEQSEDEAGGDEWRGRTNKAWGIELKSDSGSSGDESTSEREWEGWEGDLFSQRARRQTTSNRDSILTHTPSLSTSGWSHGRISTSSPSADYTFPPVDSPRSDHRDSLVLPRQLSSYSSADSLLRRTIKRASPRKYYSPLPIRASSPTARSRPISPLASQLDQFDEDPVSEPPLQQFAYAQLAYPSRQVALDSIYSGTNRGGGVRNTVPMSMTMTSITSTVSVGPSSMQPSPKSTGKEGREKEPKERRKGKGKGKEKASRKEAAPEGPYSGGRKTRKRSSTVQVGALNHKASSSAQTAEEERELRGRKSSDRLYDGPNAGGGEGGRKEGSGSGSGSERRSMLRPGKLKLTMSFAQVAALGSGSSTPRGLSAGPVSTSTSSFESPRFAHPDSSD